MLKSAYVGAARQARGLAERAGLLAWLDARRDQRTALWVRSLFAIHDIDAMVALDLPWWTFDAIDAADAFLAARPGARVFEYGSGASTIWLGRRAGHVVSVDHDAPWHDIVKRFAAAMPQIALRMVPPDAVPDADPRYRSEKPGWRDRSFRAYVHAIDDEPGDFDMIVIDGRNRAACLEHSKDRLAPGGMIVFDNSSRSRYRAAIAGSGLHRAETRGLTACLPYPDATTLLTN